MYILQYNSSYADGYNTVVQHSREFLKPVALSELEKGKIMVV